MLSQEVEQVNKIKSLTKKRLFLPIFSMILVMLINVVYDIACGNPAFSFFEIAIKNDILFGIEYSGHIYFNCRILLSL